MTISASYLPQLRCACTDRPYKDIHGDYSGIWSYSQRDQLVLTRAVHNSPEGCCTFQQNSCKLHLEVIIMIITWINSCWLVSRGSEETQVGAIQNGLSGTLALGERQQCSTTASISALCPVKQAVYLACTMLGQTVPTTTSMAMIIAH